MKRILTILSIALLASCGKEEGVNDNPSGGNSGGGAGPNEIESIALPSPTLLLNVESKEGKLLPVSLSPEGCTSDMLTVEMDKDGIVSWSVADGGILFKPLKTGQVEATIKAKSGAAASRKATIKVLSADEYAAVEISKIDLDASVSEGIYLREGDTEGKTVSVKLTPSEASTDMLKWSGGTDIVTVSAVDGGLKFVPIKAGGANVKIEAKRGSAAAKTVSVVVLKSDEYSDYVISDIKYSPSSVGLRDNDHLDLSLTLTPSAATVNDLVVTCSDPSKLTVQKGSGSILQLSGKAPGSAKITVRGLREGSKSIEIPVTVYGHLTGISSIVGKDEMMVGDESTFYASLTKTGDLMKSDSEVVWSSSSPRISVDASGKVKAVTANGSSVAATITAKCGSFTKTKDVLVWSYPTSVSYTVSGSYEQEGTMYCIKKGTQSMTVNWKVVPSTAKQQISSTEFTFNSGSNAGKSVGSSTATATTSNNSGPKTIVTSGASANAFDLSLRVFPVNVKSGDSVSGYVGIYVNEFGSTDVKPGDFIYYQNGKFNWEDGGVRTLYPARRILSKAISSGLGTFMGQVYSTEIPTDQQYKSIVPSPAGLSNKSGVHVRVIAANPTDTKTYFSSDKDDVAGSSNWKIGTSAAPSQTDEGEADKDYSYKLAMMYYNSERGDSHEIQPSNTILALDASTFGYTAPGKNDWNKILPVYKNLNHSGWMVPSYKTAKEISSLGPTVFYKLSSLGTYCWTCVQKDSGNAYYYTPNGYQSVSKNTSYSVRPILWL